MSRKPIIVVEFDAKAPWAASGCNQQVAHRKAARGVVHKKEAVFKNGQKVEVVENFEIDGWSNIVTWEVTLDDHVHTIELTHGTVTGKVWQLSFFLSIYLSISPSSLSFLSCCSFGVVSRCTSNEETHLPFFSLPSASHLPPLQRKVKINNKKVLRKFKFVDTGSHYDFMLCNYKLGVEIIVFGNVFQYRLLVNDTPCVLAQEEMEKLKEQEGNAGAKIHRPIETSGDAETPQYDTYRKPSFFS